MVRRGASNVDRSGGRYLSNVGPMRNLPFGYTESAVDRYLREERERRALLDNAFGGSTIAETMRQAIKQQDLVRSLDAAAPYRGVIETLERERKLQEELRRSTSTALALSITETARSVAERHAYLVAEQRRLSNSLLDTVRAYDANRSVVETAMAAANASDIYRRVIADALPSMSMFGAIAERMLMVDTLTLRASEGEAQTATGLAAEMVIETQRLAEAIVEAPSEEESERLVGALIRAVVDFVKSLGPNTMRELKDMGLVGFGSIMLTLLSVPSLISPDDLNPAQQAAFSELNEKVDRMREEERAYHEAEMESAQRFLAGLPEAQLVRDATFRRTPGRDGKIVLRADEGMKVAVKAEEGRWRLVVFRDPLSSQLAQAWVYYTALSSLSPPVPIDYPLA